MVQMILSILFFVISVGLVGIILVQKGKGGGLSGAFGGGGSDTFLGALQSKEIVRWTTWLAVAFIGLAILRDFVPPQRMGVDVEDLMGSTATTTTATTDQAEPQAEAPTGGATGSQQPAAPESAAPAGGQAAPPAGNTGSAPVPPPAGGTQ